jgi:sugar phosphate isomerase/epimerase
MNTPSLNRRDFLKAGAATAAVAAAASLPGGRGLFAAAAPAAPNYGGKTIPFAIQLYTVGGAFRQDPEGTLAQLASWGFKGVEFAGYPQGRDAKAVRKMLDDAGLKAVGTHIGIATMQGDALKETIEFNQIIGNTRLGVSQTNPAQALNTGGGGRAGGGRGAAAPVLIQGLTTEQINPTGMADTLTRANAAVDDARTQLNAAIFAASSDMATVKAKVDALAAAELAQANARAETIAKIQGSASKLTAEQLANLASGGRGGRGGGGPAVLAMNTPSTATKAEWEAVADIFNGIQANLRPLGMHTYYHSHPPDFNTINGVSTWEVFFDRTAKDVYMQLDLGHVGTAGRDQVELMKKYPGRANTVHVKPANGGGGKLMGDPTDGNLAKWPAIFAACEDKNVGGTEWYILEYDGGSMDQAKATAERLKQWGKI